MGEVEEEDEEVLIVDVYREEAGEGERVKGLPSDPSLVTLLGVTIIVDPSPA